MGNSSDAQNHFKAVNLADSYLAKILTILNDNLSDFRKHFVDKSKT